MAEKEEYTRRVNREKTRLRGLLKKCSVSEDERKLLDSVIENTAWMKVKLDDARKSIKESQICISYDNGGGQKGIRENPLFKGYESLFKSYMTGMKQIMDCLPDTAAAVKKQEVEKPKNMLQIVMDKRKEA